MIILTSGSHSRTVALLLLSALPVVLSEQVCTTTSSGQQCHNRLSTGVKVAIAFVVVAVLLIVFGTLYFIYRRKKSEEDPDPYAIDPYQIEGPRPAAYAPSKGPPSFDSTRMVVQGAGTAPAMKTTYNAKSPMGGSVPRTAPTTYGGKGLPFWGFASSQPPMPPPVSQFAYAGQYTTSLGSAEKASPRRF